MKDIFYMNKIIPASSINSIEINYDICDNTYGITIRQSRNNYKLISSNDENLVKLIFESMKNQCDGIDFINLVDKIKETLDSKVNKKVSKTKEKKKKVSDKNDREE